MMFPITTKPTITQADLNRGSVVRYFVKHVSNPAVTEVSLDQYNLFKNNPYYIAIKLPWVIKGNLFTSKLRGNVVLSIEEQNQKIVNLYAKEMPELKRKLKNFLEFASPTINQP